MYYMNLTMYYGLNSHSTVISLDGRERFFIFILCMMGMLL